MTDLNSVVGEAGTLHLLGGSSINNDGQIIGAAIDTQTGEIHGFVATPRGKSSRDDDMQDEVRQDRKPSFSPKAMRELFEAGLLAGRWRVMR
jgi:hypothetical protein